MPRVKICGITNLEDARVAIDAGADYLGFVFHPLSPRHVTEEQVRAITAQLRLRKGPPIPHLVGVFVDSSLEDMYRILTTCRLDHAQLHGSESPTAVTALRERGFGVIKAFRVRDDSVLEELSRFRATAYLLDTFVPDQAGGTGHTFDWNLAEQARRHGRIILAGGLTADNVAQAIVSANPWGVDVSSGVEAAPGRKDPAKVRRFVSAAKRTAPDPFNER